MYRLKIYINPDGDFSYAHSLFEDGYVYEKIFFDERAAAVELLNAIVKEMADSIKTSKEHIQPFVDTVRLLPKYIDLIAQKMPEFEIRMSYGNPSVKFELIQVTKKSFGIGYVYEKKNEMPFDFIFSIIEDYEEYNWNVLYDFPNVE